MRDLYIWRGLQLSNDGEGRTLNWVLTHNDCAPHSVYDPPHFIEPIHYGPIKFGDEDIVYLIHPPHPLPPCVNTTGLPSPLASCIYTSIGYDDWVCCKIFFLCAYLILPLSSDSYFFPLPTSFSHFLSGAKVRSDSCLFLLGEVMLLCHSRLGFSILMLPSSMRLLCHEPPVVRNKLLALLHPSVILATINSDFSGFSCVLFFLLDPKSSVQEHLTPNSMALYMLTANFWVWKTLNQSLADKATLVWKTLSHPLALKAFMVWRTLNQSHTVSILLVWRTLNHCSISLLSTTSQNGSSTTLWLSFWIVLDALSLRNLASVEVNKSKANLYMFDKLATVLRFWLTILYCNRLVILLWFVSVKLTKLLLYLGSLKPP